MGRTAEFLAGFGANVIKTLCSAGVGPDTGTFTTDGNFVAQDRRAQMRPEAIEAIFYMWRATHDVKYRSST